MPREGRDALETKRSKKVRHGEGKRKRKRMRTRGRREEKRSENYIFVAGMKNTFAEAFNASSRTPFP